MNAVPENKRLVELLNMVISRLQRRVAALPQVRNHASEPTLLAARKMVSMVSHLARAALAALDLLLAAEALDDHPNPTPTPPPTHGDP